LINSAPDEIRPKVLVSATAVGYYGTFVCKIWLNTSLLLSCLVINIIIGCLKHWLANVIILEHVLYSLTG